MKTYLFSYKKLLLTLISTFFVYSSYAQTKKMKDFIVRIDTTIYYKTIPLEILKNIDSLSIIGGKAHITSFMGTFIYKSGKKENILDLRSNNSLLTSTMKEAVSFLEKGDRIFFENIVIKTSKNNLIPAKSLYLTVD